MSPASALANAAGTMTAIEFSRGQCAAYAEQLGLALNDYILASPERRLAALPSWLRPPLVATAAARQKLAAWIASGKPDAPTQADALVGQQHIGDELLAHAIARTLSALPAPLGHYAIGHCQFISVGASIRGFCAPHVSHERPWLIVLSTAGQDVPLFEAVVAHEVSHAWLLEEPPPNVTCLSSFAQNVIMHAQTVPTDVADSINRERHRYARNERQCRELVEALGYRDPSDWPSGDEHGERDTA
jgi:hypothetical protein